MSIKLNFSPEEIEDMAKSIVKEIEEREEEKVKFLKTSGKEVFLKIVEKIKQDDYVDSEHMAYFPEEHDFESGEFHFLFEEMLNYAGDERVFYEEDNIFDHQIVIYSYDDELIQLFRMSGQGTIYQMSGANRVDFDSFNVNKIVKFEDFESEVLQATATTDSNEAEVDELGLFKKGEAVTIHSSKYPTKIRFCSSDVFKDGDELHVFLEGYEASFAVKHLEKANIDQLLEQWHESDSKEELIDYLGIKKEQYARWVETNKLTFE